MDIYLDVLREEILEPMADLIDMQNIDKAEGVWLDYIGLRVGLRRPESYNAAMDERFGFDQSGGPFDVEPFKGAETEDTVSFPIADSIFRRIIRARGIALKSDGNFPDFERAVHEIDSRADVSDKQNMTVRVVSSEEFIVELADSLGALPRPAGVKLEVVPREQFGYDDAGVSFDQGGFA